MVVYQALTNVTNAIHEPFSISYITVVLLKYDHECDHDEYDSHHTLRNIDISHTRRELLTALHMSKCSNLVVAIMKHEDLSWGQPAREKQGESDLFCLDPDAVSVVWRDALAFPSMSITSRGLLRDCDHVTCRIFEESSHTGSLARGCGLRTFR